MKSIVVFCGSSYGNEISFKDIAYELGKELAERNIKLVYGGANVGLMGTIADAVLHNGGEVIGVLPNFLKGKEIAHQNLTELIIVETMHQRKTKMNEFSDGVIALPGGFGTLEEFFEMLTWAQLGLHKKPVAILNVNGFFDSLIDFVQIMVEKGFLKEINQKMLITSKNIEDLIYQMDNYDAPTVGKWITTETI